jgi:hypothetical protein
MSSAWQVDAWGPWGPRRRWSERPVGQRVLIVASGVCVWFALVIAYGLAQRPAGSGRDPVISASFPPFAVPAAAAAAQTVSDPPSTPAAVAPAEAAPPPPPAEAPVPEASPPPAPAEAPAPASAPAPAPAAPRVRAPRSTSCDAVADLGTAEPGGTLAFRLDPRCPYRPGTVDIAINGEPPRPAQVDQNGVVWVEIDE